ncbi:ribosome small subunit-dependent GTPase A [Streptacidiphilus sp. N1-10]|uniref:Small ribosomal subunit biogenesis GTPase RsgA n=1 Tax=Streptacidiphilus jeojiensis TaxID=3229225 RepID=A0ABV6XYD9_9ACTN
MSDAVISTPSDTAHPLARYGWDELCAEQFRGHAEAGLLPGRVVRVDRGLCEVVVADGGEAVPLRADIAPVAVHDPLHYVCTGDWAAVGPAASGPAVRALLPRRTSVVRSTSSKRSEGQVLAANVDTVVIAVSLSVEPDLGRVERFLALAWESGAQPLVVLTKADAAPDGDHIRADVERVSPGVGVLVVSALTGQGMPELAGRLPGTSALVGLSGAGKSTLANSLTGRAGSTAGAVRPVGGSGKGRHTTTARELLPLPGGGVLIDTPGLRGVGMFDAAQGLQQAFAEIEALARDCRFGDCGHVAEPGCGVLAALRDGRLDERRLDSYRKLRRENERIAARTDARLRAEQLRRWKAADRERGAALRAKGRR